MFVGRRTELATVETLLPQVDAGQITMFVRAPSGTNIEENERRIIQLEEFLKEKIPPEQIVEAQSANANWNSQNARNAMPVAS